MELGERLDELRQNILRDRSALVAGSSDHLWSDETLLRYIKDADRKFARQTMCIRDGGSPQAPSNSAVTQIKLQAGVQNYQLHKAVFAVLSARYNTDTFDIQRSGHALVSQFTPPEFLTYDPSTGFNTQPGRPIAFLTDETLVITPSKSVTLTVYPVPSATEAGNILYLRTLRYPLMGYSINDLALECEIPEDYQLDALEWAAYRATANHDADAGDSVKSQTHKDAFDRAVLECRKELKRTLFAMTTLRYGSNGFNYTP